MLIERMSSYASFVKAEASLCLCERTENREIHFSPDTFSTFGMNITDPCFSWSYRRIHDTTSNACYTSDNTVEIAMAKKKCFNKTLLTFSW